MNSYKPFLDLPLLVLNPARAVVEEIQRLLEEANGMMHADLNTRLGNITLTEGAGGSQIAQTTDAGQAVDFIQRSDIGHRAGGHEQVLAYPLLNCVLIALSHWFSFWIRSNALDSWL